MLLGRRNVLRRTRFERLGKVGTRRRAEGMRVETLRNLSAKRILIKS